MELELEPTPAPPSFSFKVLAAEDKNCWIILCPNIIHKGGARESEETEISPLPPPPLP